MAGLAFGGEADSEYELVELADLGSSAFLWDGGLGSVGSSGST